MQSDALLEAGDMDGAATWRKIIKAIEVMQATKPGGSEGKLLRWRRNLDMIAMDLTVIREMSDKK